MGWPCCGTRVRAWVARRPPHLRPRRRRRRAHEGLVQPPHADPHVGARARGGRRRARGRGGGGQHRPHESRHGSVQHVAADIKRLGLRAIGAGGAAGVLGARREGFGAWVGGQGRGRVGWRARARHGGAAGRRRRARAGLGCSQLAGGVCRRQLSVEHGQVLQAWGQRAWWRVEQWGIERPSRGVEGAAGGCRHRGCRRSRGGRRAPRKLAQGRAGATPGARQHAWRRAHL